MQRWNHLQGGAAVFLAVACLAGFGRADAIDKSGDRYELQAHSATYVRYFERALLPGPGGASVSSERMVPAYEYLSGRVSDLDAPWAKDSVDFELALWGSYLIEDVDGERRFDGDVTVANTRLRFGPVYLKAGRQIMAGGAARLSHFDGISAGVLTDFGAGLDAYGGLTVLPRWDERPGYRHLGSAPDTLLRDPNALPAPTRSDNWLAGARAFYSYEDRATLGLSFHEQHEDSELGRRSAGADLALKPLDLASLSSQGVMDVDSSRLADARVALDVYPIKELSATAEYLHVDPVLLLSRQSVLSVFATDDFDETGAELTYRPIRSLGFGGGGWVEFFAADRRGYRTRASVKALPVGTDRVVAQLVYGRVSEPQNGYHSIRASLSYRIVAALTTTAEHYSYFYDSAIRGIRTSSVEAGTIEWAVTQPLRLLLGAQLSRSPYASLDAQTLLRAIYEFDVQSGERR